MYELIDGVISIVAGIWVLLMVCGVKGFSSDAEKFTEWKRKYKKTLIITAPILIAFGLFWVVQSVSM
jgi:hypothetical protein